jgi:hypothetical protein
VSITVGVRLVSTWEKDAALKRCPTVDRCSTLAYCAFHSSQKAGLSSAQFNGLAF